MKKKIILVFFFFTISFIIFSCEKKDNYTYVEPTPEFYINDNADALLQYSKWNIFINSEDLYEDSLDDEYIDPSIRGAQVVVLTYLGNESEIDSTTIFNEWGIGKNDMGILIIMFFDEGDELPEFRSITVEIGVKMMGYISAFEMNDLIDTYFFDDYWLGNYDMQLLVLYHQILGKIYVDIYDYSSYTYDSELMYENLFSTTEPLPSEQRSNNFFVGNLFGLPVWSVILIVLTSSFLGIGGFVSFNNRKGGGGSSAGYWFNRKR